MLFSRSCLLTVVLSALLGGGVSRGERPVWWLGAMNQNPSADSAVATQGQAMHMAKMALRRINAEFPGVPEVTPAPPAKAAIDALFADYSMASNNKALRISQLKYISSLFWDRMAEIDVVGFPRPGAQPYPWSPAPSGGTGNELATLGQLKMAFSMEIDGYMRDSDHDDMPDGWESGWTAGEAGPLSILAAGGDKDGDGLTNYEEYQKGTNPRQQDTDFDGIRDDVEVNIGTNPNADSVGIDSDGDGITDAAEGLIRYLAQKQISTYSNAALVPAALTALAAVDPASNQDADNDRVPDDFQRIWNLSAAGAGDGDADGDGLSNRDEAIFRTWPAQLFSQLDTLDDREGMLLVEGGSGPALFRPEYDFAPPGYNDSNPIPTIPGDPNSPIASEREVRARDFDYDGTSDGEEVARGRNPRVPDTAGDPLVITPVGELGESPDVRWRNGGAMSAQWFNSQWLRAQDPYASAPENAFLPGDPAGTDLKFSGGAVFKYREGSLKAPKPGGSPAVSIYRRTRIRSYNGDAVNRPNDPYNPERLGSRKFEIDSESEKWKPFASTQNLAGSWEGSNIPSPFPGSSRHHTARALEGKDNSSYSSSLGEVRIKGDFIPKLNFLMLNNQDSAEFTYEVSKDVWSNHRNDKSTWKLWFNRFESQGSSAFSIGPVNLAIPGFSIGQYIFDEVSPLYTGRYMTGQSGLSDGNVWPCLLFIGAENTFDSSKLTMDQVISEQLNGVFVDATPNGSRTVELRCRYYPSPSDLLPEDRYSQGIGFQTTGNIDLLDASGAPLPKKEWRDLTEGDDNGFYKLKARLRGNNGTITYRLKMLSRKMDTNGSIQSPPSKVFQYIEGATVKLVAYGAETGSQPGSRMGIQITESAGSRFRKVGINGVPLADSKPQNEEETDQSQGEMHIDALTHELYHHTSDLFVPVAASDLTLAAERTLHQEIANDANQTDAPNILSATGTGYIGKPFGICWSSGLTPHVELDLGGGSGGGSAPDRAKVVDETGASYSFALGSAPEAVGSTIRKPICIPLAAGPDQTAFMNRLEITGALGDHSHWGISLFKRFGTQTRYEWAGSLMDPAVDDGKPHIRRTRHFFRLVSQNSVRTGGGDGLNPNPVLAPNYWAVSDRYNNKLYYTYSNHVTGTALDIQKALIPSTISDFSNTALSGARYVRITPVTADQIKGLSPAAAVAVAARFTGAYIGQIEFFQRGMPAALRTVRFDYTARTLPSGTSLFPGDFTVVQLARVQRRFETAPGLISSINTHYQYADAQEPDMGPVSPGGGSLNYRHLWLDRIIGGDGRYLKFNTRFDRSRVRYCPDPARGNAVSIYYEQGKTRPVTGVDAGQYLTEFTQSQQGTASGYVSFPAGISENEVVLSRFALQSDGRNALDPLVLDNVPNPADPLSGRLRAVNTPVNAVVDGDRRLRLYRFSDPDIRDGTDLAQILFPPGETRDTVVNLAWKKLEIDHGLGAREIYTFNPEAMMALASTRMTTPGQGAGAERNADTTWTYASPFSIGHAIPLLEDVVFTGTTIPVKSHPFFPKYYPDPTSETRVVRMPAGSAVSLTGWAQEVTAGSSIVKTFTYWADQPEVPAEDPETGISKYSSPWARTMVKSVTSGPGFLHTHRVDLDGAGRPVDTWDESSGNGLRHVHNQYYSGSVNPNEPVNSDRPLLEVETVVGGVPVIGASSTTYTDLVTIYSNPDLYGQFQTVTTGFGEEIIRKNTHRDSLGQTIRQYTGAFVANGGSSRATVFEYRGDGRLLRETRPAPGVSGASSFPAAQNSTAVTLHGYEFLSGRKISVTAPDGTVTAYTHDVLGRVRTTTVTPSYTFYNYLDPTPFRESSAEYTVTGLPFHSVSESGLVTRTAYDWLRRPVLVATHEPASESFSGGGSTAVSMEYTGSWCGDSLFDASSFKPTLVRGPFVSAAGPARREASHNSLGWKVSERVQYQDSGAMAETRTAYNAAGQVIGVLAPDGNGGAGLLTLTERDVLGRVKKIIRPDGGITETEYAPASGLVGLVRETVPAVPSAGFAEQRRVTITEFDAAGRERKTFPPASAGAGPSAHPSRISYYDTTGTGLTVRTATPAVQLWEASAPAYWLITKTDYDNRDRPYKVTTGLGTDPASADPPAFSLANSAYRLQVHTAPPSGQTAGGMANLSGTLVSLTSYDIMDRATWTRAPHDAETITVYDYAGRPVRSVGPLTTVFNPDDLGNTSSSAVTFQRNICTATAYNAAGQAVTVRSGIPLTPAAKESLWSAASGADTDAADANDNRNMVSNSYDANGRLLSTTRWLVEDNEPIVDSFGYDSSGNRISVTAGGSGATTLFTHDPLNRVLTTVIRARGEVTDKFDITASTYNAAALHKVSSPDGRTKTYAYDNGLRIRSITGGVTEGVTGIPSPLQPLEPLQTWTHNAAGELLATTVADEGWRGTACTYDARGRKTSETSAGRRQTYSYNPLNQLVSVITDLAGAEESGNSANDDLQISTAYDVLGRVSTITEITAATGAGGKQTLYGYDKGGRVILKRLPDSRLTEWKTYDTAGRVLTQRTMSLNGTVTVQQGITCVQDLLGNLVFQTENRPATGSLLPLSRHVWNTYDSLNRLTEEKIYTPATSGPLLEETTAAYTYDLSGNRTNLVRATGGVPTAREFCDFGQNTDITNIIESLRIGEEEIPDLLASGFDPREPAVYRVDQLRAVLMVHVAGDGLDVTDGAVVHRYDRNGNRSRSVEFVMEPVPMGQPRARISSHTVYTWDQSNRLTGVSVIPHTDNGSRSGIEAPPRLWTYGYDHRSRRIMRLGPDRVTVEADSFAGGTAINRWTFSSSHIPYWTATALPSLADRAASFIRGSDFGGGVGGLLYSLDAAAGGARGFAEYGLRGDITGVTDSSGNPVFRTAYRAFGDHAAADTGPPPGAIRQRASTKEEETELGLLNEGFRHRDIRTGVFLSRDPAGFVDGPNLYSYVQQNPWSKFDPEGLAAADNPSILTNAQALANISGRSVGEEFHDLKLSTNAAEAKGAALGIIATASILARELAPGASAKVQVLIANIMTNPLKMAAAEGAVATGLSLLNGDSPGDATVTGALHAAPGLLTGSAPS